MMTAPLGQSRSYGAATAAQRFDVQRIAQAATGTSHFPGGRKRSTFGFMTGKLSLALLAAAIALPGLARADIFSFTDAAGVEHFSNVPSDSRYKLLLATPSDKVAGTTKEPGINWLARANQYDKAIAGAAKASTIQAALVRAVITVESGFNPRAVSKKGAIGLMQLRPATARRYGVNDIYDPEQNIRAGAHYLSDLLVRFDSKVELALAAYNAGEDAVERYGRQIPPYPETMNYVPSVMRIYHRLMGQTHAS